MPKTAKPPEALQRIAQAITYRGLDQHLAVFDIREHIKREIARSLDRRMDLADCQVIEKGINAAIGHRTRLRLQGSRRYSRPRRASRRHYVPSQFGRSGHYVVDRPVLPPEEPMQRFDPRTTPSFLDELEHDVDPPELAPPVAEPDEELEELVRERMVDLQRRLKERPVVTPFPIPTLPPEPPRSVFRPPDLTDPPTNFRERVEQRRRELAQVGEKAHASCPDASPSPPPPLESKSP